MINDRPGCRQILVMDKKPALLLMAEILHQLSLVFYPIIWRVLYILGGSGFLPSTAVHCNMAELKHPKWQASQFRHLPGLPHPSQQNAIHFLYMRNEPADQQKLTNGLKR